MHCRSSFAALLVLLLASCGDEAVYQEPLPLEPLASDPQGEAHTLRYVPIAGAIYEARVQHEVTIEHTVDANADAPARGGRETWHLRVKNGKPPTSASLGLVVDGVAKKPLTVTYGPNGLQREPGGGRALMQLTNGPDLAGLAGLESWLPDRPVRVGEAWDVPHLHSPRDIESSQSLQWSAPILAQTAQVRLESIGADGSWHLRLASRQRIAGMAEDAKRNVRAKIQIVDRITGTAQIGPEGHPRQYELHFERIEEADGTQVQHARRHIQGTVQRVE